MNSRNTIFILMIAISLSLLSVGLVNAFSYNTDYSNLKIVAEEITPEPVEPGSDVTVKVLLINDGGDSAEGVSLKLNAKYPFFLKTESSNFEETRNLCAGCTIDNTYYLVVDANAKSGLYPLDFNIYKDDMVITPENKVNIKVVGKPDLLLETSKVDSNATSGKLFNVDFDLKNIGTGIARKIKFVPNSDKIIMLGSNVNFLNNIDPDNDISFSVSFMVQDNLEPDTYKFPLTVSYLDELGNSYESEFNVGVNILNKADLDIQNIKLNPSMPTLVDDIHLEGILENIGSGEADKVVIKLITENDEIYTYFIGQVKADDDSPFYFDFSLDKRGINVNELEISYEDDFGQHSFKVPINIDVKKPTKNLITVLLLVLIIGSIFGYFKFKKKKGKSK